MENTTNSTDIKPKDENTTLYIILLSFIFLFQFISKSKDVSTPSTPEQKSKSNKLFWKFLIVIQIAKTVQWCITPYHFEFFSDYHSLSNASIAKYMSLSFMSSSLFGTLISGYLNDRENKTISCICFALSMIITNITRLIKNPVSLAISQITFGFSSSLLYSSFENWFVNKCNNDIEDKAVRDGLLTNSFEKNAICDPLTAMFVNFTVSNLKKKYGIVFPFYISILVSILVIVLLLTFYWENTTPSPSQSKDPQAVKPIKNPFSNIGVTLKYLYSHPSLIFVGITETLIYSTLHIFGLVWNPTLKELNPRMDTGKTFFLLMMGFMAGSTSFRILYSYFSCNAGSVAKTSNFFVLIGLILCILRVDYTNVLYGLLCFEAGIGMFYPSYGKIKAELLPKEHRGTMMVLFKMPFNVLVACLFWGLDKYIDMSQMRIIAASFALISFILQLASFSTKAKVEEKEKKKEKKKKK